MKCVCGYSKQMEHEPKQGFSLEEHNSQFFPVSQKPQPDFIKVGLAITREKQIRGMVDPLGNFYPGVRNSMASESAMTIPAETIPAWACPICGTVKIDATSHNKDSVN